MSISTYPRPVFRKLKGFAFDPSFSSTLNRRQSNEVVYKIRWEDTKAGPCGEYLDVIDYDPSRKCYYLAVDLEDPYVLADYGLPLLEGDPRFHQQQVYAVVMSVIIQFEKALGRKIIWSRIYGGRVADGNEREQYNHEYVPRLRIYPHAIRQQNAYYSPSKNALLFGYFQASNNWGGNNVPGATIFTCLSPDIVAHETTHAILDSIHPYLTKATNPDMLAFHEGFADIIALLQRFTFRSVVEEQIRNSRGDLLSPENMLGDLAIQFGQAVSNNRRALRSFLVEPDGKGGNITVKPDPQKLHTVKDPHSRGAILVAAVFDAFARLYKYRTADLIRLASNGTGILAHGEIDPDLVKLLSKEACEISEKLMQICIRALDYCPPADLTFGDYLRAIITADLEHNPDDEEGLRFAMMESFRSWGIVPEDVTTYSVEALRWKCPENYTENGEQLRSLKRTIHFSFDPEFPNNDPGDMVNMRLSEVLGSIERILREDDRKTIFDETQKLSRFVHGLFYEKMGVLTAGTERELGMNFDVRDFVYTETYGEGNDKEIRLSSKENGKFQVYKCRPLIIPNMHNGNSSKIMVIMFLQKIIVNLKGSRYEGHFKEDLYVYRGGASLIIDMADYKIKYVITKSVSSTERLIKQLDYFMENPADIKNSNLLMHGADPFAALHIH